MTDFNKNVVLNVKERGTESAKRGLEGLNKETAKLLLGMKGIEDTSKKALETIGLGSNAQLSNLQKLNNAFQGFTSKVSNGANNMAKAMAPWNQALELGGKAINFLGDGLDAAGKKYPSYAKDVEKLKDQFSGLKESAMAVVGVVTVELFKGVGVVEKLQASVEKLDASFAKSAFLSGFEKGKNRGFMFTGDDETKDPLAALGSSFDGFTKSLKGGVDHWNTQGTAFVDSFTEGMKKSADAAKKAAVEAARWKAEWEAARLEELGANGRRRYMDVIPKPEFDTGGINLDLLGQDAAIGQALDRFNEENTRSERFAQSARGRNETYLASMFGPIEEFQAYATAFNTLTTATESAMQAWISGSASLGEAIKKGLGVALAGLASSMAVESLKHGAYALGSLAFGDIGGASRHGVAAAAFGAGSVAAAVAAKQLGGSGSTSTISSGSGGGRDHRGDGPGGASGGNDTITAGSSRGPSGKDVIYIVDDPFADMTPRQRALAIEKSLNRSGRRTHGEDD